MAMKHKSFSFKMSVVVTLLMSTSLGLASAKNCSSDLQDPYAPSVTMAFGKFKGQCMDTSSKRALRVLRRDRQELEIANFKYLGKFYRAVIPVNGFDRMSYVVVDLNGKKLTEILGVHVSHTELKVEMKKGQEVRLYNQKIYSDQVLLTIPEFLISFNYMAPAGVPYSAPKGLDQTLYGSVLQFFSVEDEYRNRFQKYFQNMYSVDLNLESHQIARIVSHASVKSHRNQYSLMYDTWDNNCTTQIFDIIDEALYLKGNVLPFRFKFEKLKDTSLSPALAAFKNRGLVSETSKVDFLNSRRNQRQFPSPSNAYFSSWIGKNLKFN